jgi:hypothetical protein
VDYILDEAGRPVLLLSDQSLHTQVHIHTNTRTDRYTYTHTYIHTHIQTRPAAVRPVTAHAGMYVCMYVLTHDTPFSHSLSNRSLFLLYYHTLFTAHTEHSAEPLCVPLRTGNRTGLHVSHGLPLSLLLFLSLLPLFLPSYLPYLPYLPYISS